MLIQQLRDLQENVIISRKGHLQILPKVAYELTELGRALGPIFWRFSIGPI